MTQAAPDTDLTPVADDRIGTKVGPYVLLRRIGQGGMGVVYEARHEHIGQRAAAKLLMRELARDPRVLQRFLDEAKAMTMVQHEGIVKVFDYGQLSDGVPYILMELLEGQSLQSRLSQATSAGTGLPVPLALEIARQVASAISALHLKKIVHRDLKPDNLVLVPDSLVMGGERVKLLDFGLAKVMNQEVRRTSEGSILGTPLYMSPEQWEGGRRLGPKSDVYALGAMLFELLSGRPPFVEESAAQLMYRHVNTEAPLLSDLASDVSPRLDGLLALMLAKGPAARPDMTEVQALLLPMCLEFAGQGPLACRQGVVIPSTSVLSDGMGETLGAEPRSLQAETLRRASATIPVMAERLPAQADGSSEALRPVSDSDRREGGSPSTPRASASSAALPMLRSPSNPSTPVLEPSPSAVVPRSASRDALVVEAPAVPARSTSLSALSVSLPPQPQNRHARWVMVGAGLLGLLLLSVGALALMSGRAKNQAAQRPSQVVIVPPPSVPQPVSAKAEVVVPTPAVAAPLPPIAVTAPPPSEPKAPIQKTKRRASGKKQQVEPTKSDDPMSVFREH